MKVRVTGHSLGAANAALCGFDLASTGFVPSDRLYVYTYGEPRVGNKVFAQMFDKIVPNAWRLVHYADLVPHLPFMN
jgi:predicted lipase